MIVDAIMAAFGVGLGLLRRHDPKRALIEFELILNLLLDETVVLLLNFDTLLSFALLNVGSRTWFPHN